MNNLLANNILPHACRATNDPKADQMYVPEVLDLFALHQEAMQRIFCFYKRARKWEDMAQVPHPPSLSILGLQQQLPTCVCCRHVCVPRPTLRWGRGKWAA